MNDRNRSFVPPRGRNTPAVARPVKMRCAACLESLDPAEAVLESRAAWGSAAMPIHPECSVPTNPNAEEPR